MAPTELERKKLQLQQEIARLSGAITRHSHSAAHPYHNTPSYAGRGGRGRGAARGRGRGRGRGASNSYSLDLRAINKGPTSTSTATVTGVREEGEILSEPAQSSSSNNWVATNRAGSRSLMTVGKRAQLHAESTKPMRNSSKKTRGRLHIQALPSLQAGGTPRVFVDKVSYEFNAGGKGLRRTSEYQIPNTLEWYIENGKTIKVLDVKYKFQPNGNLVPLRPAERRLCPTFTKTGASTRRQHESTNETPFPILLFCVAWCSFFFYIGLLTQVAAGKPTSADPYMIPIASLPASTFSEVAASSAMSFAPCPTHQPPTTLRHACASKPSRTAPVPIAHFRTSRSLPMPPYARTLLMWAGVIKRRGRVRIYTPGIVPNSGRLANAPRERSADSGIPSEQSWGEHNRLLQPLLWKMLKRTRRTGRRPSREGLKSRQNSLNSTRVLRQCLSLTMMIVTMTVMTTSRMVSKRCPLTIPSPTRMMMM